MSKPPFDRILVADAETRWSSKPAEWCPDAYTLKKLTTEEYIRSPLFKAFGFCFKWYGEEGAAIWIPHWKLREYLDSIDWSRTAICCHNAQFDAAILAWHYGIRPACIFDTLSMARALRGLEVGNSAFKLAQDFGLPPKGDELVSSDGLYELPLEVEIKLANYCRHDTWLCEQFLKRMLPGFPSKELRLIDLTIRMFTEPQLELDEHLLRDAIVEGDTARNSLLHRLGVTESQLASNDQFGEALRALGVEPPTKQSRTTGERAFAFAKNDALFQELINSDREEVALLCEARLRVKSTQERTRAQRFLDIASRGKLPVPVNYAHTRTLRWGAAKGSNINMQNLKRGGKLRKSIVAPPGHTIVAGDLSQIEPRVLAYLSDYTELLEIFASGKDAYAQFGAQMFGIPGLNADDHPDLRQSAKSALLGCGYQLGWASFAAQLLTGFLGAPPVRYDRAFAKRLGVGRDHILSFVEGTSGEERLVRMAEIPHTCTDEELLIHCVCAKEIIDRYRRTSKPVVDFWGFLETMIATVLAVPDAEPVVYKCLTFKPGAIVLPNGLPILYDKIKVELDEKNRPRYSYWNGKTYKNLYAGVVAENVTSGTARCVIADGMLRIQSTYRCAMPVHDEAVYVVPETDVDTAVPFIKQSLTAPVSYLPGIPLGASVKHARRYGEAK